MLARDLPNGMITDNRFDPGVESSMVKAEWIGSALMVPWRRSSSSPVSTVSTRETLKSELKAGTLRRARRDLRLTSLTSWLRRSFQNVQERSWGEDCSLLVNSQPQEVLVTAHEIVRRPFDGALDVPVI